MADMSRYPSYRNLTATQRKQVDILMMQDEAAGIKNIHVSQYIPMVVDQSRRKMAMGGKACRGRSAMGSMEKA